MSQTLIGNPSSGSAVQTGPFASTFVPFPTPDPSDTCQLSVTLQASANEPIKAKVSLFRGSTQIASTAVTLSNSPQVVVVSFPSDQISQLPNGSCTVSGLSVVVEEMHSLGCSTEDLPGQLSMSLSVPFAIEQGCSCGETGASGVLTWDEDTQKYQGEMQFCGGQVGAQLWCAGNSCNDWMFLWIGCSPHFPSPATFKCGNPETETLQIGLNVYGCCGTGPVAATLTIG